MSALLTAQTDVLYPNNPTVFYQIYYSIQSFIASTDTNFSCSLIISI